MSDVERITEQNQERYKWAVEEQRKYELHREMKQQSETKRRKIKKFERLASFCFLLSYYLVGFSTGVSLWMFAKNFIPLGVAAIITLAFSVISMLFAIRFSDIANER